MPHAIQDLLDRLRLVRRACDLDLLLFLQRHPRVLLPCGGRVAVFSGYDPEEIVRTLQALVGAGLVERRQPRSRAAACLYVLVGDGRREESLTSLLAIASTRSGRAEVLQHLAPGCAPEEAAPDIHPARTSGERRAKGGGESRA